MGEVATLSFICCVEAHYNLVLTSRSSYNTEICFKSMAELPSSACHTALACRTTPTYSPTECNHTLNLTAEHIHIIPPGLLIFAAPVLCAWLLNHFWLEEYCAVGLLQETVTMKAGIPSTCSRHGIMCTLWVCALLLLVSRAIADGGCLPRRRLCRGGSNRPVANSTHFHQRLYIYRFYAIMLQLHPQHCGLPIINACLCWVCVDHIYWVYACEAHESLALAR